MAKKSNPSPTSVSSQAKAAAASKTAAPKHRRATAAKVAETAPIAVSSHHPEVNAELEVSKFAITRDDIATLAFSYWERRGYQGGSPEEDWRRAEEELQSLLR